MRKFAGRLVALVGLAAVSFPACGSAQERVPAKPGETCANFYTGCEAWCRKNMGAQQLQGCLDVCKQQIASCKASGQWSMDNGARIVTGLPPE